jgi:hypothetical protein
MSPIPIMAPLPPGIELAGSWRVRFTALDPATGAVVAGVTISSATIQVEDLSTGGISRLETADWQLVPEKGP